MKDWIDMTYEERIAYANNPPADKVPKIEARLEPDPAWPKRWRCSCCGLGAPRQTAMNWAYCPYCHSKFGKKED